MALVDVFPYTPTLIIIIIAFENGVTRRATSLSGYGARPARPRRACGGGLDREVREEKRGNE